MRHGASSAIAEAVALYRHGAAIPRAAGSKQESRMNLSQLIATAAVAAGALAAGAAHARSDVQWSVQIGGGPVGVAVGSAPYPYYARPVVVVPAPVIVRPGWRTGSRDADRDGIPNRYDRAYNPAWDRDGDGIPNRYDRVYNPGWDRDGDGIPNRHDPRYNPRGDRDGDGVPNRYDRHPRRW
jgi:hypothetical protein